MSLNLNSIQGRRIAAKKAELKKYLIDVPPVRIQEDQELPDKGSR